MTVTYYVDTDGVRYRELPGVWHNIAGLTPTNCARFGWTTTTEETAETVSKTVRHYSKLKLCRKLKELGMWAAVKAAIEAAGAEDEWQLANVIDSDDALFTSFMATLSLANVDTAALLATCETTG